MLIGFGIVLSLYLIYRAVFPLVSQKKEKDYDSVYDKILTSEEYKVKGQYEK